MRYIAHTPTVVCRLKYKLVSVLGALESSIYPTIVGYKVSLVYRVRYKAAYITTNSCSKLIKRSQ